MGCGTLFMREWTARCLGAGSVEALLEDPRAQELIRMREREKRPFKARLRSPKHLAQWAPRPDYGREEAVLYELWYRHGVGQQFVTDLLTAGE